MYLKDLHILGIVSGFMVRSRLGLRIMVLFKVWFKGYVLVSGLRFGFRVKVLRFRVRLRDQGLGVRI